MQTIYIYIYTLKSIQLAGTGKRFRRPTVQHCVYRDTLCLHPLCWRTTTVLPPSLSLLFVFVFPGFSWMKTLHTYTKRTNVCVCVCIRHLYIWTCVLWSSISTNVVVYMLYTAEHMCICIGWFHFGEIRVRRRPLHSIFPLRPIKQIENKVNLWNGAGCD